MDIEQKVKQTLSKVKINKKGKILVALSGGKDSAVTCYLLSKFGYKLEAIHIDLKMGDYSKKCLEASEKLCKQLGIKLHVYDIRKEMGNSMCNIRLNVQSKSEKTIKNCAICGVIKKWILNKEARRLKADYIATGHHLDDESQTFFLNILKGSPELSLNSGIMSRNIKDKKFVTRIKPLFYIPENEIRKYSYTRKSFISGATKSNSVPTHRKRQDFVGNQKLPVVYEKCPCALDSYRIQVREFMRTLSNKEKENLMKNAEELLDKIKIENKKMNYCEICGEPARNKICKMCELMKR